MTTGARRTLVALAIPILVLAACSVTPDDAGSPDPGDTSTTTTATGSPPPDEPGPAAVGHTTVTVIDADRGRELPVDIWYPAEEPGSSATPTHYGFVGDLGVDSEVAYDDLPVAEGRFPLIVFSHGNNGTRTQSTFLTETLASHGFVVASLDHPGNTAADLVTGRGVSLVQSAADRPADVSAVIDDLLARDTDPATELAGHIDGERIGVTGHSFGGLTSLAVAVSSGDEPFDPRVDAIAPIAPASAPLSDAALGTIAIPTMLVGGTLDDTTPIVDSITRPWEALGSDRLYRADVLGAGHLSFAGICDIRDSYAQSETPNAGILTFLDGLAEEACGEEYVDIDVAHELTSRYVIAFFLVELAGNDDYAPWLTPVDGVEFHAR